MSHATTWMNLEDVMLSKTNQSQKDRYCMIPLIGSIESNQNHRKWKSDYQGLGRVGREN